MRLQAGANQQAKEKRRQRSRKAQEGEEGEDDASKSHKKKKAKLASHEGRAAKQSRAEPDAQEPDLLPDDVIAALAQESNR